MGVVVGRDASGLQRGGIAVLDPKGNVTWTDAAWASDQGERGLDRAPIGANLIETYRKHDDPKAQTVADALVATVADALVAILQGKATYFEIEYHASVRGGSLLTSVVALRGEGAGAVVVHKVIGGYAPHDSFRSVDVNPRSGGGIGDGIGRLTPRERQVLDLMAVGLDNRAIAAKLQIEYTTVRGHVRSVIEKLGARSRLEAVAIAYQGGWVARA
jgi:DNA-binding CsgD family transcriptional regulator